MAFRNPGGGYTTRNRFSQMLENMEARAGPPETTTQGLAHLLRMATLGWEDNQAERGSAGVAEAFAKGARAKPWVNPDTNLVAPGTMPTDVVMEHLKGVPGAEARWARRNLGGKLMDRDAARADLKATRGHAATVLEEQRKHDADIRASNRRWDEFKLNQDFENKLSLAKAGEGEGPFRGEGMEAQYQNALLTLDPSNPQYAAAYRALAAGVPRWDAYTQTWTKAPMNMTGVRPPTGPGYSPATRAPTATGGALGAIPDAGAPAPSAVPPSATGGPLGSLPPGAAAPVPGASVGGGSTLGPNANYEPGTEGLPESLRTRHVVPPGMNPSSKAAMDIKKLEHDRLAAIETIGKNKVAAEAKLYKEGLRVQNMRRAGGTVIEDLGRMLELWEGTSLAGGMTGAVLRHIPLEANDVYQIDEIKKSVLANTSVNEIMKMKAASETGGALGQIPVAQMEKMEQLLGALNTSGRREIQIDNIKRIQNLWLDMVHGSPEQIQARVGKQRPGEYAVLTQERADELSARFELSFDERGRARTYPVPEGVTEADINETMRVNRMTREEVLRALHERAP